MWRLQTPAGSSRARPISIEYVLIPRGDLSMYVLISKPLPRRGVEIQQVERRSARGCTWLQVVASGWPRLRVAECPKLAWLRPRTTTSHFLLILPPSSSSCSSATLKIYSSQASVARYTRECVRAKLLACDTFCVDSVCGIRVSFRSFLWTSLK